MIASSPVSTPLFAFGLLSRALSSSAFHDIPQMESLLAGQDLWCGRPIVENIAFLDDVVDLANEYNLPVVRLSLDQEKTFFRVDWPFLFATLAKIGLGDNFIRWVKILYTVVRSSVLVNGFTSRPFKPSRRVRQGCPLSPLLYVLSREVLAAICPLLS